MHRRLWPLFVSLLIAGIWLHRVDATGRQLPAGSVQPGDPKDPPKTLPPAACPVPKPEVIPDPLKVTFSKDEKVNFEARRKELLALAEGQPTDECVDALRWLAHQNDVDSELRNQVLMVLGNWHMRKLPADLAAMIKDPNQSAAWKVQCVSHLAMHYSTYVDNDSFQHLTGLLGSQDADLRDTALLEMAHLSGIFHWEATNPKLHAQMVEKVGAGLAETRKEALPKMLQAVGYLELANKAAKVEELAGDEKQPAEVRLAAVQALTVIARAESLPVLDAASQSSNAALAEAAKVARANALIAQLRLADPKARERAFKELRAMGARARPALERLLDEKESDAQELTKTILGHGLVEQGALKVIDRKSFKKYGEDPEAKKEGDKNILMDLAKRVIIIEGEFTLDRGALEYAIVCKGENAKMHESVIALDASPLDICYALLASNYTYAKEFHENGKINLPKDSGIMLSVEFQRDSMLPAGKESSRIRVPLDLLIWNRKTGQPMKRTPWAFTGSRVEKTEKGTVLMAMIEKSVAAIMTDPNALLNTPLDTASDSNVNPQQGGAFYEINRALVPKRGTKCSLVFEPWGGGELKPEDVQDHVSKSTPPESEKKTP